MGHQMVIVLDFGGQYNQLIARRVRECGVYCEVKPCSTPLAELRAMEPIGIILTGGPNSVYLDESPRLDPDIFTWGVPILGICYGCQLMAHLLGGQVVPAQADAAREYGKTDTRFDTDCPLFRDVESTGTTWSGCRRASGSRLAPPPAPMWPSPTRPGGSTACSSTRR